MAAIQNVSEIGEETVGIGLSGGTDSTYAAFLLKQAGRKVCGFTMQLGDQPGETVAKGRRIAELLAIPHSVLKLDDVFEQYILAPFADSYAKGLTPSPCVICNARLKFGLMADAIRQAGCQHVATGHYVRHDEINGLRRGLDSVKDQSYFLAQLKPSQLHNTCFPLGEYQKSEVISAVQSLGLVENAAQESQDLCFLPNGDFASFVAARHPELVKPGKIITSDGKILGQHAGAFRYTYGQRRGLGLGGGPWFVLRVNIPENTVIVGHEEETLSSSVSLGPLNWLVPEMRPAPGEPFACLVQLRYRMKARQAELFVNPDGSGQLHLAEPVAAVTPGQLAVCYNGERVIASAWIA